MSLLLLGRQDPVADRLTVPNALGINIHQQEPWFNYANGQNMAMHDTGFRIARVVLAWQDAQYEDGGDWHFGFCDDVMRQTAEAGLRPLAILDYNNFKITGGVSPNSPELIAKYNQFVVQCIRRYKQYNPIWEIGNEPSHKTTWQPQPNPAAYTRLVVSTSKVIREEDPKAVICAGSFNPEDGQFIQTFIDQGGLANLDDISLHPYNPHLPEVALPFYRHVQKLIKDQGLDHRIGIMNTESGYADIWKAVSPQRAAEYLPRIYLVGLLAGVDVTILYEWSDQGVSFPERFGLLDEHNQPKPAFNALKALLGSLDGYHLDRFRANGDQHEYVMVFTKGDSTKVVGWTAGRDPEEMDPSTGDPKTLEDDPVDVQFEGHTLRLTNRPKIFGF